MAIPTALSYTSTIIGFVSFSFTVLTWLGVYFSLIKTMRTAPSSIPLVLGNLRQELQSERAYMRRTMKQGDKYRVFPGRAFRKVGGLQSHVHLVNETLRTTWKDFRGIEAEFLMRRGNDTNNDIEDDAASEAADNSGSEEWVDEKIDGAAVGGIGSGRRRPRRQSHLRSRFTRTKEAGLSIDKRTYYNTDLWHRIKWWWQQDDITELSNRIQRLQIRRIERDLWEDDELTRRTLGIVGIMAGEHFPYFGPDEPDWGKHGAGHHGPPSDGGGGGGAVSARDLRSAGGHRRRSAHGNSGAGAGAGARRRSRIPHNERDRDRDRDRDRTREYYEKEVVRVRERSPSERSSPARPPPSVSIVGRGRGAPNPPPPRRTHSRGPVEYEVVNPGNVHVEYAGGGRAVGGSRRGSVVIDNRPRAQSYSRERSPHSQTQTQRSRSVSRARSISRARSMSRARSLSRDRSESRSHGS